MALLGDVIVGVLSCRLIGFRRASGKTDHQHFALAALRLEILLWRRTLLQPSDDTGQDKEHNAVAALALSPVGFNSELSLTNGIDSTFIRRTAIVRQASRSTEAAGGE